VKVMLVPEFCGDGRFARRSVSVSGCGCVVCAVIGNAIAAVARILGNTPTVCRKCYVHPAVLETYLSGAMIEGLKEKTEETLAKKLPSLRSQEAAVLTFLQMKLRKKKS